MYYCSKCSIRFCLLWQTRIEVSGCYENVLVKQGVTKAVLLMIDNFDSFTWNVVRYLEELGMEVQVHRNNAITLEQIEALAPTHMVISPGPCTPAEAGISVAAIRHFAGHLPILGVCLGHQCIGHAFGAEVVRARQVMHGKTSLIEHRGKGLFASIKQPLEVTRYHSLVVRRESLPDCLEMTAWTTTADGEPDEIMALRHQELELYGVQFHPESVLTEQGHALLDNFIQRR
jgi:anthranilate synthase/aminodeoxychorismate synthase-like glutamine amidotransferase